MTERSFITDLATEAGKIMRQYFAQRSSQRFKEDQTHVTEADEKVNQLVIEKVKAAYPDDGIIGEEDSYHPDRSRAWVCDPIDGTRAYAHWIPCFAFSLALVEDGQPNVAVVYDPVMDRMVVAERGKGATLNGQPTSVNQAETLKNQQVGVGIHAKGRQIMMDQLRKQEAGLCGVNSIAYRSMLVAIGELTGTFADHRVSNYDVAASALIVEEAGGKATDLAGQPQRYDGDINSFIASNGKVHNQLVEIASQIK